jgi:hypothetical protein
MANGWFLNCNRDSSCKDGVFTVKIDDTAAAPVTSYDGFLFTGPYSGFGATVQIDNAQSGNTVLNVGQIACEGANSCDGLTIVIGYNVAVQRLICAKGACDRCFVRITATSEPIPCDATANNAPLTTVPPVVITTAAPPAGLTTATPTVTAAATTAAPVAPQQPLAPLVGVSDLTCSSRGECQGAVQSVVNPMNNFYIFCGDAACSGAEFTIELNGNAAAPITRLDGYLFEGEGAAANAVVTVRNEQSGRTVANIAKIQCRGLNACAGTRFVTGYFVSIGGVECTAGACPGCTIDIGGTIYPCDPAQAAPMTPTSVPVPATTVAAPALPVEPVPVAPVPAPAVPAPAPVVLSGSRDLSCHHGSASCQNGHYTVTNPANGFLLYCGTANSCQSATFNLDLLDGSTTRINGLMFQEQGSAAGATITVNNAMPHLTAEIERISCGAVDACTGTTIDVGYGVSVMRMDCEPGACLGCTVVVGTTSYPCDPLQV